MTNKNILLSLKDIHKTYGTGEGKFDALKHITTDIYAGEFIVILGPSGSGKSTLLNIIGGMDQATSGKIHYKQQDIGKASHKKLTLYRRNEIGFIFQFYNLVPMLNALENVQITADMSPNPIKAIDALDMVELKDFADHFPSQLSGGQQQRVAIARALSGNPHLLLCDEPTGALDSKASQNICDILIDINRKMKKTVIIVTHNEVLAKNAHRIIEIKDGMIQ